MSYPSRKDPLGRVNPTLRPSHPNQVRQRDLVEDLQVLNCCISPAAHQVEQLRRRDRVPACLSTCSISASARRRQRLFERGIEVLSDVPLYGLTGLITEAQVLFHRQCVTKPDQQLQLTGGVGSTWYRTVLATQ